jgi:putative membrane protein
MTKLLAFAQSNWLVSALALLVAALVVHYVVQYITRGLALRSQLQALVARLQALSGHASADRIRELDELFRDTRLAKPWQELRQTLHEPEGTGILRATQPAEVFFNLDNVVDPWIGSEYFRHLPGILTGFGIIGTFFGLIQGLVHFDPGLTDSADLRRGLGQLFGHVRDAFLFSGSAIAAAIAVTITEKWLYASCAKWIQQLSTALDALFTGGVGEEYLASLLKSSHDSAAQMGRLRQVLSEDLRSLLTQLSDRQVNAMQQLSADLGRSIRQSLQEPLADIARTVASASGRDLEAVRNVLEQLTTGFLTQMRETMGNQLRELGELIQKASHSVYKVEVSMHDLLEDVQRSGEDSAASMRGAVHDLVARLADAQRAHGESVAAATSGVLQQLNEAVSRMAAAQDEALQRNREAHHASAEQLRREVTHAGDAHVASLGATRELLDRFGGATTQMIERLNAGSRTVVTATEALQQATEQLARLSGDLGALQGQAQKSVSDLLRASSHLVSAAQNVGNSSHQLSNAAVRFEGVASSASVEANARRQLLISLQDVIDQSQVASREFVNLANETRKALSHSVEHLESEVAAVLSGNVRAYQKQLSDSVSSMRHALDQIAPSRDRS